MKSLSLSLAFLGFGVLSYNLLAQNWLWALGGLLFTPYWIMDYFFVMRQEKMFDRLEKSLEFPYWVFIPNDAKVEPKVISARDYQTAVEIKNHYKLGEGSLTMTADLYVE